MKINDIKDVNEITLSLSYKGKNIKYSCFIDPFLYKKEGNMSGSHETEVVFDDTSEILSLIEILEKFKVGLTDYSKFFKSKREVEQ